MTRAVLYARVSSDDRSKTGGQNLRDQLRLCRKYAEEHGYTVVDELVENDRGASGAAFDLPKLSEALELARTGQVDVLVVRELDRLSRDLAKQLIVEQDLKRAGVAIEYVLYDFPNTPEGRLNKNLRAMLAEYEREKIKQRMQRGKRRAVKQGNVMTAGHPPFGYKVVEVDGLRTFEIVEEEAKTVRLIFKWYVEGDGKRGPLSAKKIARKLTALRVPSFTDRRGPVMGVARTTHEVGHWTSAQVSAMLKRETYAGVWRYAKGTDNPIEVHVPAIIGREMWNAARERFKHNRRFSSRNTRYPYLLARRLRCGQCGCKMQQKAKSKGRYLYYRCQADDNNGNGCTQPDYFRADHVDATVWAWLRELLANQGGLERSLKEYQAQHEELAEPLRHELDTIEQLITEREAELDRLLDLYIGGKWEQEALLDRKNHIEHALSELRVRRAEVQEQLKAQVLDQDTIGGILRAARAIGKGVGAAEDNFEKRKELVELLDVTGRCLIINGEKWIAPHTKYLRDPDPLAVCVVR